jgi:drug/metabolite transporter (DMT)-like permease
MITNNEFQRKMSIFANNWSNQVKGTILCVTAVFILTPDALLVREVSHLPDLQVIFLKYLFFGLFLTVSLLASQGFNAVLNLVKNFGWIGWSAGIIWAISNFTVNVAFQKTAVANVLVIVAANPMFSAVASYFVLKETIRLRTAIAALVCFSAIIIIFSGDLGKNSNSSTDAIGLMNALVASVTLGFYLVLVRYSGIVKG